MTVGSVQAMGQGIVRELLASGCHVIEGSTDTMTCPCHANREPYNFLNIVTHAVCPWT